MLVMDADLQHPPESVPNLLRPLLENEGHFTLGSRYIEGGGTKDWALHRQLIRYASQIDKSFIFAVCFIICSYDVEEISTFITIFGTCH